MARYKKNSLIRIEAHMEGYAAGHAGESWITIPHDVGKPQWYAWLDGWRQGRHDRWVERGSKRMRKDST